MLSVVLVLSTRAVNVSARVTFPLHQLLQPSGTKGGEEEKILERALSWVSHYSFLNKEFVGGLV